MNEVSESGGLSERQSTESQTEEVRMPTLERNPVTRVSIRSARAWLWVLAAGLAGGVVSWLGGELLRDQFAPVTEPRRIMAGTQQIATPAARAVASAKNAALAFGLLGAATGAALGAAGGLIRRSPRAIAAAALSGAALGGLTGAAAAWVGATLFYRFHDPVDDSLPVPLLVHVGIGAAVGAAGGHALGRGVGTGGLNGRALLGGALGGALGQALYVVVGTFLFPLDQTSLPSAAAPTPRLVARVLLASLTAAGALAAIGQPRAGHAAET
jgi:hypothetical protein